MGLHDGAADRQAHARPIRFCREECIEEPLDVFRVDTRPGVGYGDQDTLTTNEPVRCEKSVLASSIPQSWYASLITLPHLGLIGSRY